MPVKKTSNSVLKFMELLTGEEGVVVVVAGYKLRVVVVVGFFSAHSLCTLRLKGFRLFYRRVCNEFAEVATI